MKASLSSQAQRRTKEKLFRKRSGRLRFLDRIDRIYKIMSIDELCYKVIGSAMAVHRHFGTGYLEEVYKNALMVELEALGLHAEKGVRVGDYRADIIVENRLILELKAVTALCSAHEAQLVNYLNATGIDDGLLINFGSSSLQHKHKYRIYRSPNPVDPVNPV